jgi:hypothetical protein
MGFPMQVAQVRPLWQKHSSVGSALKERERGLNRPAHGPNAIAAKLVEGLQEIACPAYAQSGADLLFKTTHPVTLARGGALRGPSKVTEAMRETFADIGDGSLKPAPVAGGTNLEYSPATPTAVSGKGQGMGAAIKVSRTGPMAPKPPATFRAKLHFGPSKLLAQLKQTLDADVHKQYQ